MNTSAATPAHPAISLWWLAPVVALMLTVGVLRIVVGVKAARRQRAGEPTPGVTMALVIGLWALFLVMVAYTSYFLIFEHFNSPHAKSSPIWIFVIIDVAALALALVSTFRLRARRRRR